MHWAMALIIVTALPPPEPTHPAFFDAARLQAVCSVEEGPDAGSAQVLCMGYVMGVADQLLARPSRRGRPTLCPSADFTPGAAVEAVRRQRRHASSAKGIGAAEFVRFALERAYPCPVDRSRK